MENGQEYMLYEGGDTSQFGCHSDNTFEDSDGTIQCFGMNYKCYNVFNSIGLQIRVFTSVTMMISG